MFVTQMFVPSSQKKKLLSLSEKRIFCAVRDTSSGGGSATHHLYQHKYKFFINVL
jgi:hypothetical protein